MKDVFIKLIDKVFDFKVLIVILVVLGVLKHEEAIVYIGLATEALSKIVN